MEDVLDSLIPHIVKCQSESEIKITHHREGDFDEKIWIDGEGYVKSWAQIEESRISS